MRRHPEIGARSSAATRRPTSASGSSPTTSAPTARATRYGLERQRDPARGAHPRGGRRLRGDDRRPRLDRSAMPRFTRRWPSSSATRARSSIPWSSPLSSPRWTRAPDSPLQPATPPRRGRYLASVRRGLVLVLCVVGLLAASAPSAGARLVRAPARQGLPRRHGRVHRARPSAPSAAARGDGPRSTSTSSRRAGDGRGARRCTGSATCCSRPAPPGRAGDPASVHRARWARAVGGHAAWARARRGRRLPEGPLDR